MLFARSQKIMKKNHKIYLITTLIFISNAIAWAYGVGMGRVSGDKAAMHNSMINGLIILNAIESDSEDGAANWCKSFIIAGNRARDINSSPIRGFIHYIRYSETPVLSDKMESKIREVTESYKPNIIDLSDYEVQKTQNGFSVKIPIE